MINNQNGEFIEILYRFMLDIVPPTLLKSQSTEEMRTFIQEWISQNVDIVE